MDPKVRDYLIRAHNKVIAHYHQLQEASSLAVTERQRIREGMARVKRELEAMEQGRKGTLLPEAA